MKDRKQYTTELKEGAARAEAPALGPSSSSEFRAITEGEKVQDSMLPGQCPLRINTDATRVIGGTIDTQFISRSLRPDADVPCIRTGVLGSNRTESSLQTRLLGKPHVESIVYGLLE